MASAALAMPVPVAPAVPSPQPAPHDPIVPEATAALLSSLGLAPLASQPSQAPPALSLESPPPSLSGFLPSASGPAMRVVRLLGLRGLPLAEGSAALTASLGTMIFLSPEDAQRGSAYARISGPAWDTLFGGGQSSRLFQHGVHHVHVEARRQNGDLHTAPAGYMLNTPPADRPKTATQDKPKPAEQPPQQKKKPNPRACSAPKGSVSFAPPRGLLPPPARVAQRAVDASPADRALSE